LCPTFAGADANASTLELHTLIVEQVLRAAASVGHVAIVTMAGEGWVEETAEKYMPGVRRVIEELQISVTLARVGLPAWQRREAFAEGRDSSHYMKRRAMKKVIGNFYQQGAGGAPMNWKNVMSIGDSQAERLALQDAVLGRKQRDPEGKWQNCHCKVAKLKLEPSVEELSAQLLMLAEAIDVMAQHDDDLDVEFDEEEVFLAVKRLQQCQ